MRWTKEAALRLRMKGESKMLVHILIQVGRTRSTSSGTRDVICAVGQILRYPRSVFVNRKEVEDDGWLEGRKGAEQKPPRRVDKLCGG